MSLIVFAGVRNRELAQRRLEFERRAGQVAVAVRSSFDVPLEVLHSLPAFFDASAGVSRSEFRDFVAGALGRYPWIYALEWIPRVPGEERAKYEAQAVADGLAGYHFKQDAPSGPPVLAEPRSEYFPLFYMEPPNLVALGLEETALDVRKLALESARDQAATVITQRLKLVQDDPSVFSLIAFHPVYRRGARPTSVHERRTNLRGFAATVFRIAPVVKNSLRGVDLSAIDVALLDADAAPAQRLLYESRPGAARAMVDQDSVLYEQTGQIAARHWTIRVGDRAKWVSSAQGGSPGLWLGLLVSALAAGLAGASTSVLRLRRQVRAARRLGQYALVEKLGEGGMGTVYRAHHALLRRPTAVKLLHAGRNGPAALARFEREVQLTSSLTHPNTVVIYDYGRSPDGVFYYAMEYIDGLNLEDLVQFDGPQSPGRVVHVLGQVCAALAEAHAVGLVHRDIKPANIMLCNRGGVADFVKVLDFGLVKDLAEDSNLSQSMTLIGTPLYIAPEAIQPGPVDGRADIYALGAVAYFMLSGGPVFTGGTMIEVCAKHLSLSPEPLSSKMGEGKIPAELDALVLRCLAKDPAARPASAQALRAALGALPLAPWSPEAAQSFWDERGPSITERARRARLASQSGDRTLEVDRHRGSDGSRSPKPRLF